MNFQKYIIIFFIVLLLIILIFLGVTMTKNKDSNLQWPPIISSCPDYWVDSPPDEFIDDCKTYENKCILKPNPMNINYKTYIKVSDNITPISGTWSSNTEYINKDGSKCKDTTDVNCIKTPDILTCINKDNKCGKLVPSPVYDNYNYIYGSRCIGKIGHNTSNLPFDPINSKCIDSNISECDPEKCGECKTSTMDFSTSYYTGSLGNCHKQKWAGKNISWDGITYGYGRNNPC